MKKTLCLLVAALFAIMSISSRAESAIDISGMSNEELLDLKNQIVDTLFARDQLIPIAPGT